MPGYIIARIEVTDWDQYREYMEATPDILERYGGQFIVRGGRTETLEGREESARVVVVRFPSFEKAIEFYHSAEYSQARKLREGAATVHFIAVEGI